MPCINLQDKSILRENDVLTKSRAMNTIESTPQMARGVYERMAANLRTARKIDPRPRTLADKVLLGHLDDPSTSGIRPGETYVQLRPDRVVFQDVLGQTGML